MLNPHIKHAQAGVREDYLNDMKEILRKKTDDLADIQNLKAATIEFLVLLQLEEDRVKNL